MKWLCVCSCCNITSIHVNFFYLDLFVDWFVGLWELFTWWVWVFCNITSLYSMPLLSYFNHITLKRSKKIVHIVLEIGFLLLLQKKKKNKKVTTSQGLIRLLLFGDEEWEYFLQKGKRTGFCFVYQIFLFIGGVRVV